MKTRIFKRLFVIIALTLFIVSCNKDHYDVSNLHGINTEGEVLLPVAYKSFTVRDLMERYELMDVIEWSESGDMSFCFDIESLGVVDGANMLKIRDVNYEESYVFENQFPNTPPPFTDTMVSLERAILFESDYIHVLRARIKSGRLDFSVRCNFGEVERVVLHSENIKDEAGNDFVLDVSVNDNTFGFDLDGLRYANDTANTLNLNFDLYFNVHSTSDLELSVDLNIEGHDLAFSEMQGFVDRYDNRNSIDSVFTLFPDNLGGTLEMEGVRIKVSERNTFNLGARLVVDTAWVYSDGLSPNSVFDPLPLSVDLPPQMEFREVLDKEVNGQINVMGGRIYASSNFIVNPEGVSEMVTVVDTNRIDTRVSVEIPFSFGINDVVYLDTVNMNVANLDSPDLIEQLTLELTFTSTLPFNLKGSFYMYDAEHDRITDTLLLNADLIEASFDGKPVKTDVTLVVDEDRMENVMRSDRIIMSYQLDSDGHDVTMYAFQKFDLFLKAKAKYKADVEF